MTGHKTDFDGHIDALVPIGSLAANSREQIKNQSEVLSFEPGAIIFEQGGEDPWTFYLLSGQVELISDGQVILQLSGESSDAQHPMAQLQPRKMSARANSAVSVLRCERRLLEKLSALEAADEFCEVTVAEIESEDTDDWMTRMLQSRLFASLPASNIHRIFGLLEHFKVTKDQMVVKQGEPGDYYYVIVSGRAEITRAAAPDAPDYRLALIGPGQAFGEEALVAAAQRNASVRMLSDGELVRLTASDFDELIKQPLLSAVSLDEGRSIESSRNAIWLDVRFPEAHSKGSIAGSVNHPLNTLRMHTGKLDEACTYLVYCDDGRQSAVAAFLLAERGFNVHYLDGGYIQYLPQQASGQAADLDLTLHDDEEIEVDPAARAAPVPRSHLSSEENTTPAEVEAAAFDAAVEMSGIKVNAAAEKQRLAEAEAERAAEQQARQRELRAIEARAREQAEAAAKKRIAEELENARQQLEQQKAEVNDNLVAEREKLERLAEQAAAEKLRAQQEREALEKAREDAEQRVAAEREAQERRVRDAELEMERRLRAEEAKLKESYSWQAEELQRLQTQKAEAEEKLRQEQDRVQQQSEKARQQLEQTRQYQQRLKEVEKASAEEAEMRELQALELQKRLREELSRKVESERSDLEQQLATNAQELARAKQERDAAEAARKAASQEAERIVAEFQEAHERKRQQEEAEMQIERERLETESKRLKLALELAQREKDAAIQRQVEIERQIESVNEDSGDADTSAQQKLDELSREAAAAARDVARTEAARVNAQAAAVASVGDLAAHQVQATRIREQLSDELDDWMKEQEDAEGSDVQQSILANQKAHMERIKKRAVAAREAAKAHDQTLINELAEHLDGRDDRQ